MSEAYESPIELTPQGEPMAPEPEGPAPISDYTFDASSGISTDDQKEILSQIEQVAAQSRMQVTDEVFHLSPQKRGLLFPVVVNFLLLAILAGGIGTFGLLFRIGERSLSADTGGFASAEGRLLEELKRESQEQLQQKDSEIGEIQTRLAQIELEQRELEAGVDQKIRDRERELRAAIDGELAAERQRLQDQGISERDIAARLGALESQKNVEAERRITTFRAEAEEERRRIEENFRTLQAEYNQSLATLGRDRDLLLSESQGREADLRAQLESRTRALEAEKTTIQRELAALADQREREELANSQLIGFYNAAKESMRTARYEEAIRTLQTARSYLDSKGVIDLPAVLKRREVEFFVMDSLTRLIESQRSRAEVDTTSLVAQANLITDVRAVVVRADQAAAAGDPEGAERMYRDALTRIPSVSRSYAYLTDAEARRAAEGRARLDGLMAQAETAFGRGDFQTAISRYRDALAYLPRDQPSLDRLMSEIQSSGYQLGLGQERQRDSAGSAAALSRADSLLRDGDSVGAAAAYVDVLSRYPRTTDAARAALGVSAAVEAGRTATDNKAADLTAQLTARAADLQAVNQQLAEQAVAIGRREKTITALQEEASGLRAQVADLTARIVESERRERALAGQLAGSSQDSGTLARERDRLVSERDELTAERDSLAAERDRLTATAESLSGEVDSLKQQLASGPASSASSGSATTSEEVQARLDRLARLENRLKELGASYRQYASSEDGVLVSRGDQGLLESKLLLDDFLTSDRVEQLFPGLWNRIKRYDRAFEQVGREAAMQDLADVMGDLSFYDDAAQKTRYLDSQIGAARDDPALAEVLDRVRGLIAR